MQMLAKVKAKHQDQGWVEYSLGLKRDMNVKFKRNHLYFNKERLSMEWRGENEKLNTNEGKSLMIWVYKQNNNKE